MKSNLKILLFVEQSYSFDVLQPVADAARAEGDEVAWYVLPGAAAARGHSRQIFTRLRDARQFGADAVIAPGNWVPSGLARLNVQVFHGLGLEKKGHFNIRGFFDLYCTPGPMVSRIFEAEANRFGYFQVAETGWPKLDPYAHAAVIQTAPDRPFRVLYAPTFSRSLTSLPDLLPEWTRLVQDARYRVRVKFHPITDPALVSAYEQALPAGAIIPVSENVLDHVVWANIVVSDTSSTVREANWLGRPVVTYRTARPDTNVLDILSASQLEPALQRAAKDYHALQKAGRDHLTDIHPYCDGQASRRILDSIRSMLSHPSTRRRKPLNLLRQAKVWWRITKADRKEGAE